MDRGAEEAEYTFYELLIARDRLLLLHTTQKAHLVLVETARADLKALAGRAVSSSAELEALLVRGLSEGEAAVVRSALR